MNVKRGIIISLFFVVVLLVGCTVNRLQRAAQDVGRIQSAATSITADAKIVRPHTDAVGRPHVDQIIQSSEDIQTYAKRISVDLTVSSQQLQKEHDAYEKLNNSIPVVVWRWFWRFVWIIGIGWVVLGVAGHLLNPLSGIWGTVGKEITAAVPFTNPFRWAVGGAKLVAQKIGGVNG